jgi:hypothetical protein
MRNNIQPALFQCNIHINVNGILFICPYPCLTLLEIRNAPKLELYQFSRVMVGCRWISLLNILAGFLFSAHINAVGWEVG